MINSIEKETVVQKMKIVYPLYFVMFASIGWAAPKEISASIQVTSKPVLHYKPWLTYYSDKARVNEFESFDLIVFDADTHPPVKPLIDRGKTVLGYISAGEVEKYRPHYSAVKKQGILHQENKDWPGSFYVDMRSPLWVKRVIEDLIPRLLHQGFRGIFLDTLDNPIEMERVDPVKYKGMRQGAIDFIKAIRYHYPDIYIMINRGYEILDAVGAQINFVLGESMYADYDFKNKTYKMVEEGLYKQQVEMLQGLKKKHPRLRIMSLDYWNPKDKKKIKEIYNTQRSNGFEPLVSTIKLDIVAKEPL
jgi:polysaccharide biosynthesis protein PelA